MSVVVNIHEAKTHFSRLLEKVRRGEEVVVAKAGRPVARLVPVEGVLSSRRPGSAKGLIEISPDFDIPLPDEDLDAFDR
ncbi:MAG: type II toxin-antitoxin system Phd/YefM family antitoxin [Magnetospirillum sp. WYHS-4]